MHTILLLLAAVTIVGAGAAIGLFVRPSTFFALGLAASIFSGNWQHLGVPIGLDRVLVLAGVGALVVGVSGSPPLPGRRRLRSVEVVMVALLGLAIASAAIVGTLTQLSGGYAILDRLGVVPFLAFVLADRVFPGEGDRRFLVATLTVVGAYLAATAVFEAIGLHALVLPGYINNPSLGTHWGRARGPFLEAGANGLALFECGTAAAVGLTLYRRHLTRLLSGVVIAACGLGILLTLTRADWIAAGVGGTLGCLLHPRARRWIVFIVPLCALTVAIALVAIPGLATKASDRTADEKSVWDRKNTDATAVRMVEAHPVFGVGWNRFVPENADYARQADGYPLSDTSIGVHNVFLSYAAELGLIGAFLWILVVVLGAGAAWRGGRHLPPAWRAAAMAVLVNWLVVGAFQPLAFAFPNLCVWLFLGIAAAPTARVATRRTSVRTPAETLATVR